VGALIELTKLSDWRYIRKHSLLDVCDLCSHSNHCKVFMMQAEKGNGTASMLPSLEIAVCVAFLGVKFRFKFKSLFVCFIQF